MTAAQVDPDRIYDDDALLAALDVSLAALARARRDGELRYTRKGKRVLYLGQWVLDWIKADLCREVAREH